MDTSDSECFESADEDFASDNENLDTISEKTIETEVSSKNSNTESRIEKKVDVNISSSTEGETKVCSITSTLDAKSVGENLVDNKKEIVDKTVVEVNKADTETVVEIKESQIKNDCVENIRETIHKIQISKNKETTKQPTLIESKVTISSIANENINLDCDKIKEETHVKDKRNIISSTEVAGDNTNKDSNWEVNDDWSNDWQDDDDDDDSEPTKSKTENETQPNTTAKEENLWDDDEINWDEESQEESSANTQPKDADMWEADDDWESVDRAVDNIKDKESGNNNTWGGWGNWGVSSILNTATQSVSSITNQVSQGFSSVLESSIGAPNPEEMARIAKLEKEKEEQDTNTGESHISTDQTSAFGFGNLISGVTKLVETTGTKVISGGLDTLETIGKKTMEVLQEGDPGLKKKRALLKLQSNKPILSQVLREAKEKAEEENAIREQQHLMRKTKNYETLFDDFQGLVHLEALEMLSKQCDIKLETLKESLDLEKLSDMQETMDQVKELCELPEEDEDEQLSIVEIKEKIESAVNDLNIQVSYDKLIKMWEETDDWLSTVKLEFCNEKELHQQAIENLAHITALAVEQFHKSGELLLVKEHRNTADEADSLVQLTISMKSLMLVIAGKFTGKINELASKNTSKENCNDLITNVFYEAENSSSYVQNAFQLLIPILQVGAV